MAKKTNLEKVQSVLDKMVEQAEEGFADAWKMYKELKDMAGLMDAYIERLYEPALSELSKYHKAELAERGIQLRNGVRRWNYDDCPDWVELKGKLKKLETTLQARAEVDGEIVDPETGELLPKPRYTTGKTTIVFMKK